MSVTECSNNVPYHQQDTDYYCGAACAQMVLESLGAGILDQDDLYAENHSHNQKDPTVNWATPPDGLTMTLNHHAPAVPSPAVPHAPPYFVIYPNIMSEDAISRKIVWTIYHYKVAPVALVYGWDHWIVVTCYEASADPTSYADTSYTISAFHVNNPWPPVPSFYLPPAPPPPAPPPHSGTDGCGTGGNRGIADEHISYSTWQSTYMTGVPNGYWKGQFIAVCDPDPPVARHGIALPPRTYASGEMLIPSGRALELTQTALKDYGLADRPAWKEALGRSKAEAPVLVQRLDRTNDYYYIIPYVTAAGELLAMASINARLGNYRQSVLLPGPAKNLFTTLDRKAALGLVAGKKLELGDRLGRIIVRNEVLCQFPTLVWQPCLESLSPYYPFYMVTVGSHRIFIRIDGQIFTKLTTDVQGV